MPTGTLTNPRVFGGAPVRYDVQPLTGTPDTQVRKTIDLMRHYACVDALHPYIQEDARQAIAYDPPNPLRGVWQWVKDNFEFSDDYNRAAVLPVKDPENVIEVIVRPLDAAMLIRSGHKNVEDCDGYSTYLASLLIALGYKPSFVTVAADPDNPNEFTHVYVAAYGGPEGRVSMDASHGKYFGWEAPGVSRIKEWPLLEGSQGHFTFVSAVVAGVVGCLIANYLMENSADTNGRSL